MRVTLAAAVVLLASVLSAQAPADDRAYQAIRTNDLEALRALTAAGGANAKDALGQTPLMLAAAFGTVDAMRTLLERWRRRPRDIQFRRDRAALGGDEFRRKRSLLLDAGADVNVATQLGRTPLMIAASAHGTALVVGAPALERGRRQRRGHGGCDAAHRRGCREQ